jgi:hypothetical protein
MEAHLERLRRTGLVFAYREPARPTAPSRLLYTAHPFEPEVPHGLDPVVAKFWRPVALNRSPSLSFSPLTMTGSTPDSSRISRPMRTKLTSSEHRGNCGRVVAHVAVISELERLESRAKRDADALSELAGSAAALEEEANERARDAQRADSALATRRQRFDEAIAEGKISGKAFTRIALDHQRALVHAEACAKAANKARAALDKNLVQRTTVRAQRREGTPESSLCSIESIRSALFRYSAPPGGRE